VGVTVVSAFLIMRIVWELLSRQIKTSRAAGRNDWDDPAK
jgi:hypothetical protein